jgi:hypothetical protein
MKMNTVNNEGLADLLLQLNWRSDSVQHTDVYHVEGVNVWRDHFPKEFRQQLVGSSVGDNIRMKTSGVDLLTDYSPQSLVTIKRQQFRSNGNGRGPIKPRVGRFYPKGTLADMPGIFRANVEPFRLVGQKNGSMTVDLNHPLVDKALSIAATVGKVAPKARERGGTSEDWLGRLATGPGLQARWQNQPTDFFSDDAFQRTDETADAKFYAKPRLVQHLDDAAIEVIRSIHARFLSDGDRVLDLMSSWQSHLPNSVQLQEGVGLGLNAKELKQNRRLSSTVVQDLNQDSQLPFADERFDVVICTASVEYLIRPLDVFREAARVLRPDGYFVVNFSNRWFPPKAIKIWTELHDFERLGLVSEYFIRSEGFDRLHTYTMRGLPRPHADKYYPQQRFSDPVFSIWGQKRR